MRVKSHVDKLNQTHSDECDYHCLFIFKKPLAFILHHSINYIHLFFRLMYKGGSVDIRKIQQQWRHELYTNSLNNLNAAPKKWT